jgi:hypothetical protein
MAIGYGESRLPRSCGLISEINVLSATSTNSKPSAASPETTVESDRRDRLEDSLLAEQSGFDLTRYNACRPQPPEQQAA